MEKCHATVDPIGIGQKIQWLLYARFYIWLHKNGLINNTLDYASLKTLPILWRRLAKINTKTKAKTISLDTAIAPP